MRVAEHGDAAPSEHPAARLDPARPDGRARRTARRPRTGADGLAAALIGLGALGMLGSVVQLAHSGGPHLLPSVALVLLTLSVVLLALPRTGRAGRRGAQGTSLAVLVAVGFAVVEHLRTHGHGPVSSFTASWYGDGAPLVPGLLGQSALLLIVAGLVAGPRSGDSWRRLRAGRPAPGSGRRHLYG